MPAKHGHDRKRLTAMLRTAALLLLVPCLAVAADLPAGPPQGATNCSGCHAPAASGGFMPINGRDAGDLSASMEAFRSGERPSTLMGRLMKGFSRDEIQAIAAWTAAQK
jgi:sulfide dehydrogenase cytochrome subunit